MNNLKKSVVYLFLLTSICSFTPKIVAAQVDPNLLINVVTTIATGNSYNVSGQTNTGSAKAEESIGKYKFIAPIEPLVSGLNPDSKTGMVNLMEGNPIYKYVQALFMFLVGVGGVLGVVRLVMVGFEIITSAAKVDAHSKIRDELTSIIISLLLVAGSYVFLNTISPNLVTSELTFGVVTSTPSNIMYEKEPTDPGYYFKYQILSDGSIKYSKKFKNKGEPIDVDLAKYDVNHLMPKWMKWIPLVYVISDLDEKAKLYIHNNSCAYSETFMALAGENSITGNEKIKVEAPCAFYPRTIPDPQSSAAYASEQDVRRTLEVNGVTVKNKKCKTQDPNEAPCTDVGALNPDTIDFISSIAQTFFKETCGVSGKSCPVVVTGGSESWKHKTHKTGDNFDLRLTPELKAKLENNATFIAPGMRRELVRYLWYEYWFNEEKNEDGSNIHFHVCKQSNSSNPNMCTGSWGGQPLTCVPNPGVTDQYLCTTTQASCPAYKFPACGKVNWDQYCSQLPNDKMTQNCKDAKAAGQDLKNVKVIQPFKDIYAEYF